ncbi:MAG: aminotransferase class V-fold PLP-dependent enzyme [Alkaliphilus sp.]
MDKVAYFDNAATTFPKSESVYTFMDYFHREYGVNVGRGQHKLAFIASKLVDETKELLKQLFNCNNKKIVFAHTATEALNIILQGLVTEDNFNIYITPFEHNAVTRVLHYLSSTYKVNIIELEVDRSTMNYDLEAIKYQFAEQKPNIVIMSHASNVCGVIAPIDEISKMAKKYEAINVIDMCQTAGLLDIDLSNNNIDFAVFAAHKTLYGPFGVAGFVCSTNRLLKPLLYGGTGIDSANQDLPKTIPERYEVASPNIVAIAGLNASLKWMKEIGKKGIIAKESENHDILLSILKSYENISIIGQATNNKSIGVISCKFNLYSSDNIGRILSERNIAVRTGLHCAPLAHKFLRTYPEGTVRFSIGYFTRDEDFTVLEDALDYIEENS